MSSGWEKSGPIKCQATFPNHCHFPKCDCDREWTTEDFKKARPFKEVFPDLIEESDHPHTCRCEVCRFWS